MSKTFKADLTALGDYLREKKKLQELSAETGVSVSVVNATFKADTYEELTASKLIVYEAAIKKVAHLKSLPSLAREVIND